MWCIIGDDKSIFKQLYQTHKNVKNTNISKHLRDYFGEKF